MPLPTSELLRRAGLARVDGPVYDALVAKGRSSIADICRQTGLHRPTVYRSLSRLENAGLAKKEKNGKRAVYASTDPERLSRLVSAADAENAQAAGRFMQAPAAEDVTVLRGQKGLAVVLEDITRTLGRNDVFYRCTSRKPGTSVEGFVPKDYRAARDAKKIQQFVITNAALRAASYKKRTDCLSKAVPRSDDAFEYDIALVIYGDKVATVDYLERRAVIVRNARLAKFHARLFKLLFDRL